MLMSQLNFNNETNKDWSAAASIVKDEFGSMGERAQRYVADITKGWLIIVVAGLVTSISMSLVRLHFMIQHPTHVSLLYLTLYLSFNNILNQFCT